MVWKTKKSRIRRELLLVPFALLLLQSSSPASALWGVLPGKVLGRLGEVKIVPEEGNVWTVQINPSTVTSPEEGTSLDTTEEGKGIFFGTIGNQVSIRRQSDSGAFAEWTLGKFNAGLKSKGGVRDGKAWLEDQLGYSQVADEAEEEADDDGEVYAGSTVDIVNQVCENCVWKFHPAQADQSPYAGSAAKAFAPLPVASTLPSYFLTQNSIKTEVWECVPLAMKGYWPMMSELNGVHWHASPEPLVRAIGEFGNAPVHWKAKGWWQGPVEVIATTKSLEARSSSMNNVTLVDAFEMWPCDMLIDYYVPGGEMALSDIPGSDTMLVSWDAQYYCSESSPDQITPTSTPPPTPTPPPDKTNRPPTIQLTASLAQAGLNQNISFQAIGQDPDGDFLKYTFFIPGEGWTPYRGASTIVRKFAKEGNPTVTAMVSDGIAPPVSATASVKIVDPVWDTLVLYRGKRGYWKSHVRDERYTGGIFGGGGAVEKVSGQEWLQKYVKKGGSVISEQLDYKFMKKTAPKMARWLTQDGYQRYSRLLGQLDETFGQNAIVVMSRIDPVTGQRVYKSGIWENFANKAGWPRGDTVTYGYKTLKNNWQTGDNKQLKINGVQYKVNVVGYQYYSSPIILDIADKGEPDLLAGPSAWKKSPVRQLEPSALREFDLDGSGVRNWEWAGPTAGILVWGSQGDAPEKITAHRLFGTSTWGKSWGNGYQPLATLDRDRDGWLSGEESENIHVWTDENSNATVDKGEIKTLQEHRIDRISVVPKQDEAGNTWSERGFEREDGSFGASWDWWSMADSSKTAPKVSVFRWKPIPDSEEQASDLDSAGGIFVLTEYENGKKQLVSFVPLENSVSEDSEEGVLIGILYLIRSDGDRMFWESPSGAISTTAKIEGEDLVGVTVAKNESGDTVARYGWVAVPLENTED